MCQMFIAGSQQPFVYSKQPTTTVKLTSVGYIDKSAKVSVIAVYMKSIWSFAIITSCKWILEMKAAGLLLFLISKVQP